MTNTLHGFTFISYTDVATAANRLLCHYFYINVRCSDSLLVKLLTLATSKLMLITVGHY